MAIPDTAPLPEIDPWHDDVKWWSFDQAVLGARRYGVVLSRSRIKVLGCEGVFECGRKAGAPSLKTPVNKNSFLVWVQGGRNYKKSRYQRMKT